MPDDIVLCKLYDSEMDAVIARSVLDSEGISAMIMKDDVGGMSPGFQGLTGVQLMVRRGRYGKGARDA